MKAVFFDVGGVLINRGKSSFGKWAKSLGIELEELTNIFNKYSNGRGKVNHTGFFSELSMSTKKSNLGQSWKECYFDVLNKPFKKVYDLAERLRDNYSVGIITNVNKYHHKWRKEAGIYENFDPIIASYEVGCEKPNPEIYNLALQKLQVNAEESILIDDLEENILSAEELGFKAILFKNPHSLEEDLLKLNLIF